MRITSTKKFLILVALALVIICFRMDSFAQSVSNTTTPITKPHPKPTVQITLGSRTIVATLANTDKDRVEGLLGWPEIHENQGMLLDFVRPGVFAIHMQGMKFPIDALWIDSNDVIRLIYEQIQPNSGLVYPSIFAVRYCLEIAPGFCRKHGIKEGQKVSFRN